MQENRISKIEEGDFEGIVPFKYIYISHCIYFFFILGLHNLDSLGLAHNHLKEIPARVFSHLKFLNSLELDGNTIIYIDPEAFYGLEGKSFCKKSHVNFSTFQLVKSFPTSTTQYQNLFKLIVTLVKFLLNFPY